MRLASIALVLILSGQALAQRVFGVPRAFPAHAHHSFFLGGPWYADYNADVFGANPQVIVVQMPSPAAPVVKEEPKPVTPLMIELQNGNYVRSDQNKKQTQQVKISQTPAKVDSKFSRATADITPATLIFRDGHREQVREYTVANGVIYAQGNYWVDGYWNKKILLSALDVPATISANQGSGAHFQLPSAANVVIVSP